MVKNYNRLFYLDLDMRCARLAHEVSIYDKRQYRDNPFARFLVFTAVRFAVKYPDICTRECLWRNPLIDGIHTN